MSEWRKARKKPVVIEYREVIPNGWSYKYSEPFPAEIVKTREGEIVGFEGEDFIIKGVEGELYPIKKDIFYRTYEVIGEVDYHVSNPSLPCECGIPCDALQDDNWCTMHDIETWYLPNCVKQKEDDSNEV